MMMMMINKMMMMIKQYKDYTLDVKDNGPREGEKRQEYAV